VLHLHRLKLFCDIIVKDESARHLQTHQLILAEVHWQQKKYSIVDNRRCGASTILKNTSVKRRIDTKTMKVGLEPTKFCLIQFQITNLSVSMK